jgi:uncharacterized RDD family membrane protein YckC
MSSTGKLIIETPEQTVVEFALAGIGSRFLAVLIDILLQTAGFILLFLLALPVIVYGGISESAAGSPWVLGGLVFVGFLLQSGYFAFFETVWNGQTPGKRWTHLRVIKDSGRPVTAEAAILRNLLRIVDYLPTLYATGIITILISPQHKRVGDYVAGTVVIREKGLRAERPAWDAPVEHSPTSSQLPMLSPDELQLVESFLQRRGGLEPDVRWAMARQIAERLGQRWSVAPEVRPDPEKFLEVLAEHSRSTARFR